jgi:hypothetical protein
MMQLQTISPSDVAGIFGILEEYAGANRGATQECRLKGFAGALPGLRYRLSTPHVVGRYNDQRVAGAYLLAYYPHHIDSAFRTLIDVSRYLAAVLRQRPFRALFLAGGPMPELVALALLASKAAGRAFGIEAENLDIHPWDNTVTNEILRRVVPGVVEDISCRVLDLRNDVLTLSSEFDLIMMQSCLNEMNPSDRLIENVARACASLRPGGRCVVSEFGSHIGPVRGALERAGLVVEDEQRMQRRPTSCFADPPHWLLQGFYAPSREIPRRAVVCSTLVMRKPL